LLVLKRKKEKSFSGKQFLFPEITQSHRKKRKRKRKKHRPPAPEGKNIHRPCGTLISVRCRSLFGFRVMDEIHG
jgi:hypothetical protein